MSWNWTFVFRFFNFALLKGNYPAYPDMKGRWAIGYNRLGKNYAGEKMRWWGARWELTKSKF